MKTLTVDEAQGQLAQLIAEAHEGKGVILTHDGKQVTLFPQGIANPEADRPELEAELLKAVQSPHPVLTEDELRHVAERAQSDYHA